MMTIEPYHMNGLNWRLADLDSDTDNIVVVTGFMPSWWKAEYDICFNEQFHLDSDVHRKTLGKIESHLYKRFGNIPNFYIDDNYIESYPIERRYGDALIPALFGANVSFDDASGHPYAECLHLSTRDVEKLTVPDVENHPIMRMLIDEEKGGFDRTTGELGFEGVINIAYELRGQEMFIDMIERKELLRHLNDVIWETMDRVVRAVRRWQDPENKRPSYLVNCDCLINMLSSKMYGEQLLEFDKRFANSYDVYGIHTCNWTVDPYLDAISEIDGLAYLDMGPESDLEKVHRLFPELRPSVFFPPKNFHNLSVQEIRFEVAELSKRIGRGYILLSDLEAGTTDDQIRAAYEEAANY